MEFALFLPIQNKLLFQPGIKRRSMWLDFLFFFKPAHPQKSHLLNTMA